MNTFGARSERNLVGVHPSLVAWAREVIKYMDVCILDGGGLRTQAQATANAINGTGVKNSLHMKQADGFGHALDLIPYPINWKDTKRFDELREIGYREADKMGLLIQNGADWDMDGIAWERKDDGGAAGNEHDGPHWQIPQPHREGLARAAMARRMRMLDVERAADEKRDTDPGDLA
jgi:peptidoglycan L-alanyl-D-glutamate endopeptidase CwlK